MGETKTCPRCKRELTLNNFHHHSKTLNNTNTDCKDCHKTYNSDWYEKNKARCRKLQKEYRDKNPEKMREAKKRYHLKNRVAILERMQKYINGLKDKVFNLYGNKCACCGETNREFFALDHLEGGGTKERKRLGTRGLFIRAAKPEFQKSKYQLLCHNCNMSLGFFGYCPHHPERTREVLMRRPRAPYVPIP